MIMPNEGMPNEQPSTADMGPHVLVVDDDTRLRSLLRRYLTDNAFTVSAAADAAEARSALRLFSFDILVVDVMMPGENGIELVRSIRDTVPSGILLLTARGDPQDRITGLEAGADDYLAKPFEPRELLLRLTNILKRIRTAPEVNDQALLRLGEHVFDSRRRELSQNGRPVRLTSAEIALLGVLADQPGQPMSREEMMERTGIGGSLRSIDVQVTRLRRKVEPDAKAPRYLQTVRGEGYVLRPDG
ncbi:response regulator transcription factor [Fodinicurvata sp. EGI_FJ10296]|uniref:response regulator transcription factor n=1 Tax=Fodinicurvata sp. EGI_FJ10296 TaxID=3231908 RepID=UPI003451F3EB